MKGFIAVSTALGDLIIGTIVGILLEAARSLGILERPGTPGSSSTSTSAPVTAIPRDAVVVNLNAPIIGFEDTYALGDKLVEIVNRAQRRGR